MKQSKPHLFLLGYVFFFAILLFSQIGTAHAQWSSDFIYDDKLAVKITIDGTPITKATETNPIIIDLDTPLEVYLQINNTYTDALVVTGKIWFYYQGVALFPIEIRDPVTNTSEVTIPAGVNVPPVSALLDFGQLLSVSGVDIATGMYQASVEFTYHALGDSETFSLIQDFYLLIPADPITVLTSAAGIATGVATVGAVTGLGSSIWQLIDGFQTAHKIRSIQKKASELKSLPNLTVLGATPALFSLVAARAKMKKKKTDEPLREDVAEYRLKQKIRELAPAAWPAERCPKCRRKWNSETNFCKKCKIDDAQARIEYAEYLASRTEKPIKLLAKKKALSVRKIAKKTKLSDYDAGVIGAAMVDAGLTEITKVDTPIRSFATNTAGLIFLVLTWQQLLGGASSQFQTTLTFIGAGLSFAVIVALYVARKNQVEKFQSGDVELPIDVDETDGTTETPSPETPPPETQPSETETESLDDDGIATPDKSETGSRGDDRDSDMLPPERLEREKK